MCFPPKKMFSLSVCRLATQQWENILTRKYVVQGAVFTVQQWENILTRKYVVQGAVFTVQQLENILTRK